MSLCLDNRTPEISTEGRNSLGQPDSMCIRYPISDTRKIYIYPVPKKCLPVRTRFPSGVKKIMITTLRGAQCSDLPINFTLMQSISREIEKTTWFMKISVKCQLCRQKTCLNPNHYVKSRIVLDKPKNNYKLHTIADFRCKIPIDVQSLSLEQQKII